MAHHRYHGVGHEDRPDLQHLRPAHAAARRPRGPRLHEPGAAQRGRHDLRSGKQTRSFCYVTDLVDGILRLADSKENDPVNIGNPHEMTIEDIARTIIKMTGATSQIVYRPLPEDDPEGAAARHHPRPHALGWEPKVGLEEGLTKTLEYFRKKV